MPLSQEQLLIPAPPISPLEDDAVLAGVYTPSRKSYFLTTLLRSLAASQMALFRFGRGSLPHRIMDSVALVLEDQSFFFAAVIKRALRESAYRAFYDPTRFPQRFPASRARGYLQISGPNEILALTPFPADSLFATPDGRTVRSVEAGVLTPGASVLLLEVVSEIPGRDGNLPARFVNTLLSANRFGLTVENPLPISGGRDPETDDEIYLRFQRHIRSFESANYLSVLSAGFNARYGTGEERTVDAVLIRPWQHSSLNGQMGLGYLVIDSGIGGASSALLGAAQTGVDRIVAFGEDIRVLPGDSLIVNLVARITVRGSAPEAEVRAALIAQFTRFFRDSLLEDGSKRGEMVLFDLKQQLDACHPDIVTVVITSHTEDFYPPLAARMMAGTTTLTLVRGGGQSWD